MGSGGLNVVNMRRQIDVGGRHRLQRTAFNVANFGAHAYRFGVVVADFEFAGELDDGECRPLRNFSPCAQSMHQNNIGIADVLNADNPLMYVVEVGVEKGRVG